MPNITEAAQIQVSEDLPLLGGDSSQSSYFNSALYFVLLLNGKVGNIKLGQNGDEHYLALLILNERLKALGISKFHKVPLAKNKALITLMAIFNVLNQLDYDFLRGNSNSLDNKYIKDSFNKLIEGEKHTCKYSFIKDFFISAKEILHSNLTHVLIWMVALDIINACDVNDATKLAKIIFDALIMVTFALHPLSLIFPDNRFANLYLRLSKSLNPNILAGWILLQTMGNVIGLELSLTKKSDDISFEWFFSLLGASVALVALRSGVNALEGSIKKYNEHFPSERNKNRRLLRLISIIRNSYEIILKASVLYQGFRLIPELLDVIQEPISEDIRAPLQVGVLSGLLFLVGPIWQLLCHKYDSLQEKSFNLLTKLILAEIVLKNILYMAGEYQADTISLNWLIAYFSFPAFALLLYSSTACAVDQKIIIPRLEKKQNQLAPNVPIMQREEQVESLRRLGLYKNKAAVNRPLENQVHDVEGGKAHQPPRSWRCAII